MTKLERDVDESGAPDLSSTAEYDAGDGDVGPDNVGKYQPDETEDDGQPAQACFRRLEKILIVQPPTSATVPPRRICPSESDWLSRSQRTRRPAFSMGKGRSRLMCHPPGPPTALLPDLGHREYSRWESARTAR